MKAPCTLHQVSDHVWWFTPESRTDRPSLGLVVGERASLMLDVGASPAHTQQFLNAIAEANLPKPTYAALTHWHWDHVFGLAAFENPVIAHRQTAEHIARMAAYDYSDSGLTQLVAQGHEVEFTQKCLMIEMTDEQRANLALPPPQITVESDVTFNLGSVTCEMVHVGGDHSADSCVFYIPQDKVLFMGDCFAYTVYELPNHYTRAKLLPLIGRLETFDPDSIIEGHYGDITTLSELHGWFKLIRGIYTAVDQLATTDSTIIRDYVVKNGVDEQALKEFDDFMQPIAQGIQQELKLQERK